MIYSAKLLPEKSLAVDFGKERAGIDMRGDSPSGGWGVASIIKVAEKKRVRFLLIESCT